MGRINLAFCDVFLIELRILIPFEMLELDEFLNWCDTKYTSAPHCQCGAACTNGSYCGGVQTNCYQCIKRVHSYRNSKVHYNCDKMLYYYALKHTYRFGAEIFFELWRLRNDIANWPDIYIASIGCGPCSELFGALSFWRTRGKSDALFHFRGFDTEPLWLPIMQQVCNCFNIADVLAVGQDAFVNYELSQERIDIIVLNYMLSDMKKFHDAQYQSFLQSLISLIKKKHPKYLLVNDIYLRVSLTASKELVTQLKQSGIGYKIWQGQYHHYNPSIGRWGNVIQKQSYAMNDAVIVNKYAPFSEVNGIQTIVKFV